MGEIVIEEMNYKAYLSVLAYSFLLIASLAFTIYGFITHRLSCSVPGMFSSAVFLVCFIASMGNALKVRKLITITHDGIVDNSSVGGVGFISYNDIKEFIIITVNSKEVVAVIPKNIDSFLTKFNMVRRQMIKRNISSNLPPVTIYVDMAKDMAPKDILSLLQKRLSDYSSLYN